MSKPAHSLRFKVRITEPFAGEVEISMDLQELATRMARYAIHLVRGTSNSRASAQMKAKLSAETLVCRNVFLKLNGQPISSDNICKVFPENPAFSVDQNRFRAALVAELVP